VLGVDCAGRRRRPNSTMAAESQIKPYWAAGPARPPPAEIKPGRPLRRGRKHLASRAALFSVASLYRDATKRRSSALSPVTSPQQRSGRTAARTAGGGPPPALAGAMPAHAHNAHKKIGFDVFGRRGVGTSVRARPGRQARRTRRPGSA